MASASQRTQASYGDLFRDGRAELSLAIVLLLLVATLDILIVATAMPAILGQLGGVELYSWSFSAYTLTSIASLPVFGALTGRWGLLRTMSAALGVFVAGSVLGALAPSMLVLVMGRAVQGIGAGGLFAIPYIIIGSCYPSRLQPRALALTSGVWGISSLLGPLVGGLLLQTWGWPAIFWVNLPICGLVLLLGQLGLRGAPAGDPTAAPANLLSPLLLTGSLSLLLAAPSAGPLLGWLLGGLGLLAALVYALAERRSEQPIVPLQAWRASGPLGAALAVLTLAGVGFFAAETFLPLLMQGGRGLSPIESGIIISLGSIGWTTGSLWVSRRDDLGLSTKTGLGLLAISLGVALLLLLVVLGWPVLVAYGAWSLAGLGMGILTPVCTTVILDAASGPQAASITASSQLALGIGSAAGTALAGIAAALGFGPGFAPERASAGLLPPELLVPLHRGVAFSLVLALVATLLTLPLVRRLPREREVDAPEE